MNRQKPDRGWRGENEWLWGTVARAKDGLVAENEPVVSRPRAKRTQRRRRRSCEALSPGSVVEVGLFRETGRSE